MNYSFSDCQLNTGLYTLQRAGKLIRLRPKVFRVCLYLLEHRDRVVSRDELCAQVWSGQFISQTTLEGVIRAVRQAVGDSGHTQSIIQTLHGYGYRFVARVEERPTSVADGDDLLAADDVMTERAPAGFQPAAATVMEVTPYPALTEEPIRRLAFDDDDTAASPSDIAHEEPRAVSAPASRPLSAVHMGIALAVLLVTLLTGWWVWEGVKRAQIAMLDKSRVAVLPFLNLGPDAERDHFADGLTEVMIARLSQVPGLTVIPRTSVMKYKDTRKDVATIGRELQVGTLLEGSVRTINNQIRINAQLIDVISQAHLWSEEYDREYTEVFSVQSDIAARVAQQLTVQLIAKGRAPVQEMQRTLTPSH